MANFDENHEDVLKVDPVVDDYDPARTRWTKAMDTSILQYLTSQREGVQRGAKKAYTITIVPLIISLLKDGYGISFSVAEVYDRIENMKSTWEWWKSLLSHRGVYMDEDRGLVCVDTSLCTVCTDEATFHYGDLATRRYYLYNLPPLMRSMEAAFGENSMF
jgi:Myb/SANT-like DNA-binding domain